MAVNPNYTNVNEATTFYAGGGGGGSGPVITASTITTEQLSVSTITGAPTFLGPAAYIFNQTAINDGITLVSNPPGSFGAPLTSTVGVRLDMGGQVGYILQNPTAGLGPGVGLNIFSGGITLGSSQGVEIAGPAGNGAGSLAVSSLSVSSINGATPGGGGGAAAPVALQCSTNTYFAPSDGLIPIGSLPTIPGHLYNAFFQIDTVSTFATPAADDRICIVSPTAELPYCQDLAWWASTMVHNPRGDSASFQWKADNTSTSVFHVNANGTAPSTLFALGNSGVAYITDLGVPV